MSRPLHRGVSGIRVPDSINDLSRDSQSKDKTEKDDFDKRGSSDHTPLGLRSPLRLVFSDKENGFASDPFIVGTPRSRFKLLLFSLKFSLVFIAVVALVGSFWWTLNLSSSSRGRVYHGYRRLQEKLVSYLMDIGEFSKGASRWKELETCSSELENFVPCFNVSDGNEFQRKCEYEQRLNFLILPPLNYKVPLRWSTEQSIQKLLMLRNSAIRSYQVYNIPTTWMLDSGITSKFGVLGYRSFGFLSWTNA